jgi:hypothetical protein
MLKLTAESTANSLYNMKTYITLNMSDPSNIISQKCPPDVYSWVQFKHLNIYCSKYFECIIKYILKFKNRFYFIASQSTFAYIPCRGCTYINVCQIDFFQMLIKFFLKPVGVSSIVWVHILKKASISLKQG